MIVLVHVPKCAGTSMMEGWRAVFADRAVEDYPPERPGTVTEDTAVVHGHFPATTYRGSRVVVLREPVERTISFFHQWDRRHRLGRPLWSRFHEPGTFEPLVEEIRRNPAAILDFARLDPGPYWLYLDGLALADFEVVGTSEDYPLVLEAIEQRFGHRLPDTRANPTEERLEVDAGTRREMARVLSDSVELWKEARTLARQRRA
tara:strand:- start:3075 stop:3686 length:612 start_codon:yes stop_codon:yes gene_type:complete